MFSKLLGIISLILLIGGVAEATTLDRALALNANEKIISTTSSGSVSDSGLTSHIASDGFNVLESGFNVCVPYKWDQVRYASGANDKVWLINKGSGTDVKGSNDFYLNMSRLNSETTNTIKCAMGSANVSFTKVVDENWHQYCCRYHIGTLFLYIDGAPVGSTTLTPIDTYYTPTLDPVVIGSNSTTWGSGAVAGGSWDSITISPTVQGGVVQPLGDPAILWNNGKGYPIRPVKQDSVYAKLQFGYPLDNKYYGVNGEDDSGIVSIPMDKWTPIGTGKAAITQDTISGNSFTLFSTNPNINVNPSYVTGMIPVGYSLRCINNGVQVGLISSCTNSVPSINSVYIPASTFTSGTAYSFEQSDCEYKNWAYTQISGGLKYVQSEFGNVECNLNPPAPVRAIVPFSFPESSDGRYWFTVEFTNLDASLDDLPSLDFKVSARVLVSGYPLDSDPLIGSRSASIDDSTARAYKMTTTKKSSIGYFLEKNGAYCAPETCKNLDSRLYLEIRDARNSGSPIKRIIKGITVYWVEMID